MNEFLTKAWRTVRFPLMICFATLPVPLIILAYFDASYLSMAWMWPVAYVVLDTLSTKIPKKWRIPYGIAEVAVMVALALFMSSFSTDLRFHFIPIFYIVILLIGISLTPEGRNEQIGPFWIVLGMACHLVSQFLQLNIARAETTPLDPIGPWTLLAFFLFVLIGLITMNQNTLSASASGRQNASKAMQRKNLLLTLVFFSIALAVTFIPKLVSTLAEFFRWFPSAILTFLVYLRPDHSNEINPAFVEGGPPTLPSDAESAIPPWLDVAVSVILDIVFVIVMFWVIRYLIHKLADLAKVIRRLLNKYLHAVSEDYVDEITDTRTVHEQTELTQKKEPKLSSADIRKLTPNEQVRYRYRQLMRKHPEWARGSTARENLSNTAASVYERVRYSSSTISQEDAGSFISETKKI